MYRCPQNRVYQASLSASRSAYRRRSQSRNAAALAGVYAIGPYSLLMCHIASAGCREYRCASAVVICAACSRYRGEVGSKCSRLPKPNVSPSSITGSTSGCPCDSQIGGAAVGVARSTLMLLACNRSIASSSQSKVNCPGSGSSEAQANTPSVTRLTPARRMSSTSSSHTARSHCSGL